MCYIYHAYTYVCYININLFFIEKEKVVDTKYKNPFDPSNGGLRFDDESDDDEDKAVDGGATTDAR